MGHRLSKTSVNRCNVQKQKQQQQEPHLEEEEKEDAQEPRRDSLVVAPINIITGTSSINLQIPNTPPRSENNHQHPQQNLHQLEIQRSSEELASGTATSSNLSTSCPGRQIIIKIQLAKMENEQQQQQHVNDHSSNDNNNKNNSNSRRTTTFTTASSNTNNNNNNNNNNNDSSQFLNVTFNQNLMEADSNTGLRPVESLYSPRQVNYVPPNVPNGSPQRFVVNNNFSSQVVLAAAAGDAPSRQDHQSINLLMGPMNELQLSEKHSSVVSGAASSKSNTDSEMTSPNKTANETISEGHQTNCAEGEDAVDLDNEYCCRRKAKSNTFPSKWRCCRCTCRDAFKRIMDASSPSSSSSASSSSSPSSSSSSSSKSSKKKERKEARSLMKSPQKSAQKQPQHSSQHPALWAALQPNPDAQVQLHGNNLAVAAASAAGTAVTTSNGNAAAHMSIWSPSRNNVIIPISSPQFVVVQCPPSSLVTLGRMDDNSIRLMATELVTANSSSSGSGSASGNNSNSNTASRILPTLHGEVSSASTSSSVATPNLSTCPSANVANVIAAGPVVHSQVDYIHCLVPDLERITKASFYWGKMDRYEAERLLEGKPEGTFLLRDSAQEEYLFSVTFRKYGRSLHARIEQSNHKFSFDCHDPCVFTASTVTGLLEHYKDPACVMFFEPMLTIPLHRNKTFTLQQLCRATIVSSTSYDGINELELPSRLKSYLKEYHYKQKLRVKPFDEPFYTCT